MDKCREWGGGYLQYLAAQCKRCVRSRGLLGGAGRGQQMGKISGAASFFVTTFNIQWAGHSDHIVITLVCGGRQGYAELPPYREVYLEHAIGPVLEGCAMGNPGHEHCHGHHVRQG